MYKINKFVHFIVDGDYTILFNLQKDSFLILGKELADIVNSQKNAIDKLADIHPELFRELMEKNIVIPESDNEVENMVESWKQEDNNPMFFGMIINPTLGCNLRCWYCYENHDKMPIMQQNVVESIFRLIEKKTESTMLRKLNVSFFGGEPLLGFNQVITPVLTFAAKICKEKNIELDSNFTTNGVLLSDEKLTFLKNVGLTTPATFQISLDGNRECHNQSRIGANKEGTYDTIVENIKRAIGYKHRVFVRLNYTSANILTFYDVLDEFKNLNAEEKTFLKFNFQQIWQDKENDMTESIEQLKEAFRKENFPVDSDHICHRHSCYADKENQIVINYDGNIFKCTARDFVENNKEGELDCNGEIIWNERYKQRMAIKYSNEECLKCDILPICNGGCSQNKLDANQQNKCYRNIGKEEKNEIIIKRLKELITMYNK